MKKQAKKCDQQKYHKSPFDPDLFVFFLRPIFALIKTSVKLSQEEFELFNTSFIFSNFEHCSCSVVANTITLSVVFSFPTTWSFIRCPIDKSGMSLLNVCDTDFRLSSKAAKA